MKLTTTFLIFTVLVSFNAFGDTVSIFRLAKTDTLIENTSCPFYRLNGQPFSGGTCDTMKILDRPSFEWTIMTMQIENGFVIATRTQQKGLIWSVAFKGKRQDQYVRKEYVMADSIRHIPFFCREEIYRDKESLRIKTFDNKNRICSIEDGYYDKYNQYIFVKSISYDYSNPKRVCKTKTFLKNNQKFMHEKCKKKLFD